MIEDLVATLQQLGRVVRSGPLGPFTPEERQHEQLVEDLEKAARLDPHSLTPHLGTLVDVGVLAPSVLFVAADEAVLHRLIDLVDAAPTGFELEDVVLAVAAAGGSAAEEAFRRWAQRPPVHADGSPFTIGIYPREGGWTLTSQGSRRLCSETAYALEPTTATSSNVGEVVAATCPWCRSPLWTAIDVDATDGRVAAALSHSGWSGRLHVASCQFCSCYTTTFVEVDSSGGCRWSRHNVRPPYLGAPHPYGPEAPGPEDPGGIGLQVGEQRPPRSASAWDAGGSTLGGHPQWIQDADYPECPGCSELMDYVALIGGRDISDWGEGAYYVYVHASCGVAAVNYQQS